MTDWSPNRRKIGDLLEALSSIVILPADFEQPRWTDGRKTGPIVATSNGLLDVVSLKLYPHTPVLLRLAQCRRHLQMSQCSIGLG